MEQLNVYIEENAERFIEELTGFCQGAFVRWDDIGYNWPEWIEPDPILSSL